jgi:biotin carboxyl carrier protein
VRLSTRSFKPVALFSSDAKKLHLNYSMQLLISYSHRDAKFAQVLKRALEKHGLQVWLDKHEMSFGDQIAERLKNEILRSDLVLVVITPNSLVSNWVLWEIEYCLQIESLYNVTKLVPILMNGNLVPSTISTRMYADFRTSSEMDANFARLIKQILPARNIQPLEEQPIAYARLNEEVLSAPEQIIVTALIVGTVYLAPSPVSEPFVSIGTTVRPGDTLLIIEAMKLMNEIQSDCDGIVADILVRDGQPVEYKQPLMLLSPPSKTV